MAKLSTTLFFFLFISAVMIGPARSSTAARSLEFIHTSCASTLYPNLCFASLSPYAESINQSPLKLSQAAAFISLSHVRSVASELSTISASASTSSVGSEAHGTVARALKDCTEVMRDASDRTRDSMAELKKLKGTINGSQFRWCLSNVQTWMSAALTNEETCMDGLKEVGAKIDVGSRVGVAEEYTSIALALANKLAN